MAKQSKKKNIPGSSEEPECRAGYEESCVKHSDGSSNLFCMSEPCSSHEEEECLPEKGCHFEGDTCVNNTWDPETRTCDAGES